MSDNEFEEEAQAPQAPKNETKRIFVNHVNTFNGKNIAKFLSKCVVGASQQDAGEEEGGNEEETEEGGGPNSSKKENTYHIYGTMKSTPEDATNKANGNANEEDDPAEKKPDFVKELIDASNKQELLENLMECDVIIYDITQSPDQIDEACWAISTLHTELDNIDKPKSFILLSTVMTWAKTKPVDPEETEIPFTEEDFRRRKPHPNYKEHLQAEKTCIKFGKTNKRKLSTFVVCSGLTYGHDQSIFHYLFKRAWHNEDLLLFGTPGKNILPAVHVNDLASVMQNIADSKPKIRYLVVVDDAKCTLRQITRCVAKSLGTGKFKPVPVEDALLNKELTQSDFDMISIDLRMDAAFIKDNMQIRWQAETGFTENINKLIREYKVSRSLTPFRVCLMGPPGVGKSTVAKQLAEHYKVHHIHCKDVITRAIDDLNKLAKRVEQENDKPAGGEGGGAGGEEDDNDDDDDDDEPDELPDFSDLEAINEQMEQNGGRLDDQYVIKFFKERLMSKPCQNQGFILDGFPKSRDQAMSLFEPDEGADEESEEQAGGGGGNGMDGEETREPKFNKLITPDIVIKMDASDDFLYKRIMNLPEKLVQDTNNSEEAFTRRLVEYRENNNEENTVSNVFEEEFELDVVKIGATQVEEDRSLLHKHLCDEIKKNLMKEARNYGLSPDEKSELKRVELEARMVKERTDREERERLEVEEANERVKKQTEWNEKLESIKKEELEYLETQSVPLRNYLMMHVMPTLTKGLIECCKQKPDDPIDYLAEYLFKSNPQVD